VPISGVVGLEDDEADADAPIAEDDAVDSSSFSLCSSYSTG
jgi:hypothetical protein